MQKKIISIIIALLILIFLTYLVLNTKKVDINSNNKNNSKKNDTSVVMESNVIAGLKSNPTYKQLIEQANSNVRSQDLFNKLDNLANSENSQTYKNSLKLYAASVLMNLSRSSGTDYYMAIADSADSSNMVKAYALTQITQYASMDGGDELLQKVLGSSKLTGDELKLEVNRKIFSLYPMGLAGSRIALAELNKNPTKVKAQELYNIYIPAIDNNIEEFSGVEGLSHFVPNVYLNKAKFLVKANKLGVSNNEEIVKTFESAISASTANKITKQYSYAYYADYLAGSNQTDKAKQLIDTLFTEGIVDQVKSALIRDKDKDFSNLYKSFKSSINIWE